MQGSLTLGHFGSRLSSAKVFMLYMLILWIFSGIYKAYLEDPRCREIEKLNRLLILTMIKFIHLFKLKPKFLATAFKSVIHQ